MVSLFTLVVLWLSQSIRKSTGQAGVVGFNLKGVPYSNGSTVLRAHIGVNDEALQCTTDKITCCTNVNDEIRDGNFFFPDGTQVPTLGGVVNGYYRNRQSQHIRLHRQPSGILTGQFRCNIPDATGTNMDLFINIVEVTLSVFINASGHNTAGETFVLECSTDVTGSTDQPLFTWLDDEVEITSFDHRRMVSTSMNPVGTGGNYSWTSTLTLNPLRASDTGTFMCRVMVGGTVKNASIDISVNEPDFEVQLVGSSSTPVAGSQFSLACRVTGAERLTDSTITYQWFKNGEVVSDQTIMDIFSFTLLYFSDFGAYKCQATVMSSLLSGPRTTDRSNYVNITLDMPALKIEVSSAPDGPTRTAGFDFTLTCTIEMLDVSKMHINTTWFQWLQGPSDNRTTHVGDDSRTINSTLSHSQLQFSPLMASHGGRYTCKATILDVTLADSFILEVHLPVPKHVDVIAPMDKIFAGSSLNLTCIVELFPAVDVPVSVTTTWSGPTAGGTTTVSPIHLMKVNLTNYLSWATVDEARNGTYSCKANVSSSLGFVIDSRDKSGSTTIAVTPLPPPTNLTVIFSLATSIGLSWNQPHREDEVHFHGYEINYSFEVIECGEELTPAVVVTLNNDSQESYTIKNSSTTPVEEDSKYSISITAVYSVGKSEPSNTVIAITAHTTPGIPQFLRINSTSISSVTVWWDRVKCRERNGHTDSYRVVYYPASSYINRIARTVSGTTDSDRMFTATGLVPRTAYTFEVQASNTLLDERGPAATLNVTTTTPQDFGFLLDSQLYPNNSIVTVNDIGIKNFNGPALYCLTPSTECCETPSEANVTREWYLPDGRQLSSADTIFTREQVSSAVSLYRIRDGGTSPTGVFRCDVPDSSGSSRNIYVGLYPQTHGSPYITSVLYDRDSSSLTCSSTGGPPTTVAWRENGVKVNDSLYQQSKRVVDAETATYANVLFNDDINNFLGTFTCEVSNIRGTAQETVELNGVSIVRDQLTVGQSATARCISDLAATSMEWETRGAVLARSATSVQQLDLVFTLVNDSIHDQIYTCQVTREDRVRATQNFTAKIDGNSVQLPPSVVIANVSRSGTARAGMAYNLTCTVSKTVGGLSNPPIAVWTTGKGAPASTGNKTTVFTTITDTEAISIMMFDPLMTSHEGIYICVGNLTSPALETPLMPSISEENHVQISTPRVIVTIPSDSFYAGRTTLGLTCTISINPATDTFISLTDMDIVWINGSMPLSNSDARVTISSPSGSGLSFTSILTLSPLSLFDSNPYTCVARARPPANVQTFIVASEQGENTVSLIVTNPLPPTVSIVPSSSRRTFIAGQNLTLNCSASVQGGIHSNLTMMWTKDGIERPGVLGGLISLSLSFVPLLTSHNGVYDCTVRLFIPEAGVDISATNTTRINVLIPPPLVTITGSPRNTSFFPCLDLTLTCSITVDEAVDTPVTVEATWRRNGTELFGGIHDGGRITVSKPPVATSPFQATNLLEASDAGLYECTATITPQNTTFINGTKSLISRNITIAGFPKQIVDPIIAKGSPIVGISGYTLICNTSRGLSLPSTSTLSVNWLDPSGSVIVNGENFTTSGSGPTNGSFLTSRLTFNRLHTLQAGEYTCRTLQTIPGVGGGVQNHFEAVTFTVTVKLPTPTSLMFRRSRNITLNVGTNFSLTCLITPNTTGVDTSYSVQSIITGPGLLYVERVNVSQPTPVGGGVYEAVVTFKHLLEIDEGSYNCSVRVISSLKNVVASDSTSAFVSINVEPIQLPNVTVSSTPILTAGHKHMLTCTATVEELFQARPTLVWSLPEGINNASIDILSTTGTESTTVLTFNTLHTSHAGTYKCNATVIISGLNPVSQTAFQKLFVQIPHPSITMYDSITPFNGVNFTLTAAVELNWMESVDTNVTISGVWSSDNGLQMSAPAPYPTNLTFQPLTTNHSGEYNFTVTIQPSDGSPFIVGNIASAGYNLFVRPLPFRPPKIVVVSRHPSPVDGCGTIAILGCTADQVKHLFSPPNIVWIGPNDTEISTEVDSDPRMDPATKQLIFFSNITSVNRGTYSCRAVVNIPKAQIVNHIDESLATVGTEVPGMVQNLICSGGSGLTLSWELPATLGSEVVDYRVEVHRLEHSNGTREVVQSDVAGFNTEMTAATVNQGLFGEVPYNITVKALNLAGCGPEQQVYCFMQEGVSPPPINVVMERLSSTSIGVSWTKLTLVELKGLANYVVTYNIANSRMRQPEGMVTVPWTQNHVIISNLQPGAEYDITVHTSTEAGMSEPVVPARDGSSNNITVSFPASTDNSAAITGGMVAAVILLIAVTIMAIIIVATITHRRHRIKLSKRNVEYDQPGAMLRDFSFVSKRKEACESVDHVYEIVDKGNQTCDDPKPNICELAQCPAYIPSTHDIPSDGDYATIEDTVGLGDRNVEECDDDIGIYATIPPH